MLKKIFILPIKFYRYFISPMLPRSCKYHPSCSSYAMEAITKQGVVKGLILGVWRILRCNPYSHGGFDPVKEDFKENFRSSSREEENNIKETV